MADRSVGATSWVVAYQSTSSPASSPLGMANQVGDLVGLAVRGRRAAADVVVLAQGDADVAEHEHEQVVGHLVHQPSDPAVHALDVLAVGIAQLVESPPPNFSSTMRSFIGPMPSFSTSPGLT